MKRLSLTTKISLLVLFSFILIFGAVGIYFDGFLRANDLENTKKKLLRAYTRIQYDKARFENNLQEALSIIGKEDEFIASVDLINNYQNRLNYNAILLDEEKKILAEELLKRVRISLNFDITLYDKREELIAFVTTVNDKYKLSFISYEHGKRVLYSKFEDEDLYKKETLRLPILVQYKHKYYYKISPDKLKSDITYHYSNDSITIKAHGTIFDNETQEVLAHVELSNKLSGKYFNELSQDLDMNISLSLDKQYTSMPLLQNIHTHENLEIIQTKSDYISAVNIQTLDKQISLVVKLNKTLLNDSLSENRQQLFLILLIILSVILILLRLLFIRGLSRPLEKLMGQIEKIDKGDYSQSSAVHTNDELEIISKNINQLAKSVQERELSIKESQKDLEHLSSHDPLTNLPNRRYFLNQLSHAIKIAKRSNTKLAVLFIDLDEFKEINDTLGHDIGDELLLRVSERLKNSFRDSDTVARIGGDEFNILIENYKNIVDIELVLNKLLVDFEIPFLCSHNEINVTSSIGVALYPDDGEDSMSLIKQADLAMYKSKADGKNNYSFFSKDLSEHLEQRALYINALKSAIDSENEFILYYQPKVDLSTEKIVAIEALIRWNSPSLGFISPDKFISLAEETNLIIPIGEWILKQACRDFVLLQDEGIILDHISINISSVQLEHSDFLKTVKNVIQLTRVDAKKVELEITESYTAQGSYEAIKVLQTFRELGLRIAIDDFGTGYSSLSYLMDLPVTRLKIDKSFVDDLPHSKGSIAIIKTIITLAKTLGLSITAEGVENKEQLEFLSMQNCDEIQGYIYSKPLTIDELKKYYKKNKNIS